MAIVLDGSNLTTTGVINSGTAVTSTSGTSIDFTGIPAGVKRITVMFNGVSTNGTSQPRVQLGSGSVSTTGYAGTTIYVGGTPSSTAISSGFDISPSFGNTSNAFVGHFFITLVSGNVWVCTASIGCTAPSANTCYIQGNMTLGGTLDRVRITTVNGTDTFDAGSINILYE